MTSTGAQFTIRGRRFRTTRTPYPFGVYLEQFAETAGEWRPVATASFDDRRDARAYARRIASR